MGVSSKSQDMNKLIILLGIFLLSGLVTAGFWGDVDSDQDGLTDAADDDDDNDGILDNQDADDDGDGVLDGDEDDDGDGLENDEDPDDDNDGVMDQGSHQSRNYYLTSNIQNLLRWI